MTTRADRLRDAIEEYGDNGLRALEHGDTQANVDARLSACLTILAEAEKERDDLEAEVERLRKREPTQEEGEAGECGPPNYAFGECFVDSWTGRRCRVCRRWVWGGPTVHASCEAEKGRDEALAKLAEREAAIATAKLRLRSMPDLVSEYAFGEIDSALDGDDAEIVDKLARLARYEAPGPALLVAEHDSDCDHASGARSCIFDLAVKADAYREQHARCVAVVERAEREERSRWESDPAAEYSLVTSHYLRGVEDCLAALKDGAK